MRVITRVLLWPVISLLITGGLHFTAEAIWPDLKTTFIPPTLAPLLLAYGLWVGYRSIGWGGAYGHAIVAAAILGVLPIARPRRLRDHPQPRHAGRNARRGLRVRDDHVRVAHRERLRPEPPAGHRSGTGLA